MAEGQADRTVLFNLALAIDPRAKQVLSEFERAVMASQAAMQKATTGGPAGAGAIGMSAEQKAVREQIRGIETVERAQARAAKEAERASTQAARRQEQMARAEIRRGREAQRERERAAVDEQRRMGLVFRERMKLWKAEQTERAKAARESEKAAAAEERGREKAQKLRERSVLKATRGLGEAFGGVTGMAEGAAFLGLTGEEDTEKLLQGIVQIKGAFEVLRSGVEVWHGLTEAAKAYRTVLAGVKLAERAVAISEAGGAIVQGFAGAAGRVAGSAARGAVARAAGNEIGSIAGGAVAGAARGTAARGTAAGVVGGAAAGAARSEIGNIAEDVAAVTAANVAVNVAGRTLTGVGGTLLKGLAVAGGVLTSLPAAIAAATAGTLAAGAMITNIGGARDKAAGWMLRSGASEPGTLLGWYGAGGTLGTVFGWETRTRQLREMDRAKRLEREAAAIEDRRAVKLRTKAYAHDRDAAEAAARNEEADIAVNARLRGINARMRARGFVEQRPLDYAATTGQALATRFTRGETARGLADLRRSGADAGSIAEAERTLARQTDEERITRAEQARSEAQMALASERARVRAAEVSAMTSQARASFAAKPDEFSRDRLAELTTRELEAAEKRQQIEHDIAQQKIGAANAGIEKAKQEIDLRTQSIAAERSALMTAKERFGQLDAGKQQYLIQLKQRAQSGQYLSVGELKELENVGTRAEREFTHRQYRERADQAQFGRFFGEGERTKISQDEADRAQAEIRLKDQREFKITVERDDEQLARSIADQADKILQEHDQLLAAKVTQMLTETKLRLWRDIEGWWRQRAVTQKGQAKRP